MKRKNLLLMLLVVCGMVFAAESNYVQFTLDDFNTYDSAGGPIQEWTSAQMITLSVQAGSSVYLSNYINTWYGTVEALGTSSYAAGYDMSAGSYGYMIAEKTADGKVTTDGVVHLANGATKDVTYKNPNGTETKTTTGYLLDTFENDTEIFFVMTPNGYNSKINSYLPVNDPNNDPPVTSILASRQINTVDLAGNIRVNFGTVDGVAHEFVLGYEAAPPSISGQPLPGVLSTIVVACCSIACAKKMKKNK
ncbi:MAG: hypothetical protein IKX48_06505 [Victivallales bacterium]|nr:hypothetical protein [Victivallales bacterium]